MNSVACQNLYATNSGKRRQKSDVKTRRYRALCARPYILPYRVRCLIRGRALLPFAAICRELQSGRFVQTGRCNITFRG